RHRVRAARAGGDRPADARPHGAGDRPPPRHRARGGQDPRARGGTRGGERAARRPARRRRALSTTPRPAVLRGGGGEVTAKRRLLFIAGFDDVHAAHATHRVRALERLGTEVATFDLNARPGLLERFRAGDTAKRIERVLDEFQPHLVLTTHADVVDEDTVDRLRGRSAARWVTWLVDDLRTVTQATALARPYDAIYAVGTDVAAEVGERLGRTVDVLSNAADPSVYRPLRTKDQYRANVVFAGTATPRRERLLGELVEFGLAVWGPGWRRTALKDYCRG